MFIASNELLNVARYFLPSESLNLRLWNWDLDVEGMLKLCPKRRGPWGGVTDASGWWSAWRDGAGALAASPSWGGWVFRHLSVSPEPVQVYVCSSTAQGFYRGAHGPALRILMQRSLILTFLKNFTNDYKVRLDFVKTPGKKNLSREKESE